VLLKAARVVLGLRQVDVAERAGIDPSLLSRIERGERNLTPTVAVKLANVLGGRGNAR
jgi:transcriptional regulator with XRE-family HTH domain